MTAPTPLHPRLPGGFDRCAQRIADAVVDVDGQLREREIRFLSLAAACPTARGRILEIGSFKGRSTIVLAKAAALAGEAKIYAVDPMTAPAATDPSLGGKSSSLAEFEINLRRAGVSESVELFRMTSARLAKRWTDPLRLLWIDGDHTYPGTKADFDGFAPHLEDRAILVMDDVLRLYEGPSRVFAEDVLLSPNFGACGVTGKLGWAQFVKDPRDARPYERRKLALYRRISDLIPYAAASEKPAGLRRVLYRLLRHRVPHDAVDPRRWLAALG